MSKTGDGEQLDRVQQSDIVSCIHICARLQSIPVEARQGRWTTWQGEWPGAPSSLALPTCFSPRRLTRSRCLYRALFRQAQTRNVISGL